MTNTLKSSLVFVRKRQGIFEFPSSLNRKRAIADVQKKLAAPLMAAIATKGARLFKSL